MRTISRIVARVACLLSVAHGVALADSPTRPPYDHVVCSNEGAYCAFVSATDGVKVFKVDTGNKIIEPSYGIAGYFPRCYISDDGRTFVAVESIIVPEYVNDHAVVRVWSGGRLTQSLFLRD